MAIRIALIGLGKISVDQHVPSIANDEDFLLVAGVSPRSRIEGLACHSDLGALFAAEDVHAVAINSQPQARFALAREALMARKHALLEKRRQRLSRSL